MVQEEDVRCALGGVLFVGERMKQMTKLEMGEELSIDQEDLAIQLPAPRSAV